MILESTNIFKNNFIVKGKYKEIENAFNYCLDLVEPIYGESDFEKICTLKILLENGYNIDIEIIYIINKNNIELFNKNEFFEKHFNMIKYIQIDKNLKNYFVEFAKSYIANEMFSFNIRKKTKYNFLNLINKIKNENKNITFENDIEKDLLFDLMFQFYHSIKDIDLI